MKTREMVQSVVDFQITDELWKKLEDFDLVAQYERAKNPGDCRKYWNDLIKSARDEYTEACAIAGNHKRSSSGRQQVQLDEKQLLQQIDGQADQRANAMQDYLANLVSKHVIVRNFRAQLCQDEQELLTEEQADLLLVSPAAARLTFRHFQSWQIPIISHNADLIEQSRRSEHFGDILVAKLRIDPPSGDYVIRFCETLIVDGYKESLTALSVGFPISETTDIELEERETERIDFNTTRPKKLYYPTKWGGVNAVEVWPHSVLDDLRRLSETLANAFHYHEYQALWFILTGNPPQMLPIRARTLHEPGGIGRAVSLRVLPWISHKTVEKVYRKMQQQILRKDKRNLHSRSLELFQYVNQNSYASEDDLDWKEMHRKWNSEHADIDQFTHPSKLKQCYQQAAKVLTRGMLTQE